MIPPKFKEIKIPENTKDLKNFLPFCKDYSDYKKYINYHNNEIKKYTTSIEEYSKNIVRDNFLKTYDEWMQILNDKDKNKIFFELFPNLILRCGLTGEFFQINKYDYAKDQWIYNSIDDVDLKLEEHKIFIRQHLCIGINTSGPKRYKSHAFNQYQYEINLIDYSITFTDRNLKKQNELIKKWNEERSGN